MLINLKALRKEVNHDEVKTDNSKLDDVVGDLTAKEATFLVPGTEGIHPASTILKNQSAAVLKSIDVLRRVV